MNTQISMDLEQSEADFSVQNSTEKERRYMCIECGKCFRQSSHLRTHSFIHSGQKNYKCKECGKCFTRSDTLKTHMHTHTGTKNYKCLQCGKGFTQIGSLKTHKVIHSGKKDHKCVDCGKCFSQISHLSTHMTVHTGERKFKCAECGKSFTQNGNLKKHMAVHSQKSHQCEECGKVFARSDTLRAHKVSHAVKIARAEFEKRLRESNNSESRLPSLDAIQVNSRVEESSQAFHQFSSLQKEKSLGDEEKRDDKCGKLLMKWDVKSNKEVKNCVGNPLDKIFVTDGIVNHLPLKEEHSSEEKVFNDITIKEETV